MSHDAFLAAVRASPADDLPRLVYADWLEEHGDADRAAFIRAQVELARLPDLDPRRPVLEDRAHELLAAHEPAWLGLPADAVTEWEFARGFVDQVELDASPPLDRAAPLARHPVRRLGLAGRDPGPGDDPHGFDGDLSAALAALAPALSTVERLDLTGVQSAVAWADPFTRGLLPGLRSLALPGFPWVMLPAVLRAVTRRHALAALEWSPHAPGEYEQDVPALLAALAPVRLERLALPAAGLTSFDLVDLLAPPTLSSLTALDVSDNPLGADAYRAFTGADPALRLTRLDVSGTPLAGVSLEPLLAASALRDTLADFEMNRCGSARRNLEVLAASGFWTRAKSLRLHSGTIPTSTLEPLADSPGPPGLRLLDLADNYLRAAGVRMLAESPWAGGLTWLALSRNYLDDAAVEALAASGRFTHLRTLHLAHNRVFTQQEHTEITDAGAFALAHAPSLARLRTLTVSDTAVDGRGALALLEGPHWRLSALGLSGLGLAPRTAAAVAASPRLARLEWLDLSDNPLLGGDALLPLAESPHLSPLCELDVGGVRLSDRTRAALRERLGPRLSE